MKFDNPTILKRLPEIPGWELEGAVLVRKYKFPDFVTAFGFMTMAALVAEKLNHHPDWTNVYNRIEVRLSTHDAGGVTELDFDLAKQMNRLAETRKI